MIQNLNSLFHPEQKLVYLSNILICKSHVTVSWQNYFNIFIKSWYTLDKTYFLLLTHYISTWDYLQPWNLYIKLFNKI